MFEVPDMNAPIWEGAKIICKQPLTISSEHGPINIPVGTKGEILFFDGSYVNIELGEPFEFPMNQLRLDFLYYWSIAPDCKPPGMPAGEVISMIIKDHPDGGPKNLFKFIGYWAANENPLLDHYHQKGKVLPWPGHHIDLGWDAMERTLVANYLNSCRDVEHWRGISSCRLCGKLNGSTDKGDGVYVWPSGFSHYVEAHSVRPPKEFIEHVLKMV